jgi:predicted NUDIX family NTP pyrophosphohydrolase
MTDSAGILVYRQRARLEVLLGHYGGPFWASKDDGAWGIPKGELSPGEDLEAAARREFAEETGQQLADAPLLSLGSTKQRADKVIHVWAIEGDYDAAALVSNRFEMEWPPRSGKTASFPEVDRYEWFDPDTARRKLGRSQVAFIDRLEAAL